MLRTALVASLALLGLPLTSAAELQVNQYEGPKECDDADKATKGSYLSMHYTGTIDESSETGEKGSQFDSSRDRGAPFDFQLGQGMVIKGWDDGIKGLCKGAKATLIIPPDMGYGEQGAGDKIPGGATLNFDIEVLDVSATAPPEPDLFAELDTDEDGSLTQEEVLAFFVKRGESELPPGLWENEDKNQDGKISRHEFSGPQGGNRPHEEDPPSHEEL